MKEVLARRLAFAFEGEPDLLEIKEKYVIQSCRHHPHPDCVTPEVDVFYEASEPIFEQLKVDKQGRLVFADYGGLSAHNPHFP